MSVQPSKLSEGTQSFRVINRKVNELIDEIRANQLLQHPKLRVSKTTLGTIAEPLGGGSSETPIEIVQMIVWGTAEDGLTGQFQEHDCVYCRTWDGSAAGSTGYYVAKPYKLRRTPWTGKTVTIGGMAITYNYFLSSPTSDVNYHYSIRTASFTSDSVVTVEKQVMVPRYQPHDRIYCVKVEGGIKGTNDIDAFHTYEYIDLNVDGRAWARKANQSAW